MQRVLPNRYVLPKFAVMKKLSYLFLIFTLINCTQNKQQDSKIITDTLKSNLKSRINERIKNYRSLNNAYMHWIPDHSDTTKWKCKLTFRQEYAIYEFQSECLYYYFTDQINDTIILYWTYKNDCILNLNFMNNSYDFINSPKCLDIFSIYTLYNDTTIQVKYFFPEWIRKVNELAKDSIFPAYFYMLRKGST